MPYIPIIPIIIVVLLILLFAFVPMRLWITALASGSHVGIGTLIGMRLRKVPPARIVLPLIQARKAGLQLNTNQLESHYMAGGHVDAVVNALIASSRAGMNIPFEMAAAIDLAGRDVLEAVRMSVNPKVIETPNISAVAKDGIELLVKARVTVRTNINQLVGGAGEATVIARVGEGIVTTVGSADSHKSVLENPDSISKAILQKGLDIADVDIGRNIGAHLQSLQAEADKNIAQAKAEERRAAAVALEQEMKASVVAAEAEVPKALAEALRTGRMGFKDYYDLQNLKADTKMRQSIAGETEKPATI